MAIPNPNRCITEENRLEKWPGAAYELQKVQPKDRKLANVVRSIHDLRDLNSETEP